MNNKILNIFQKIICYIFLIIISYLLFSSIFSTSIITIDSAIEHTFFLHDNILKNLIFIVVLIVLLFLLKKNKYINQLISSINTNQKKYFVIKAIILLFMLIMSLVFVLSGKFYPTADQYSVQTISGDILGGDFTSMNQGEYLNRCPHQSGLILISSIFSFFFGTNNYVVLGVINCFLITLFYKVETDIFDELGYSNVIKLLILLSSIIFPIMILYSHFIYGTIPGLLLGVIALKYEIRYLKNNTIFSFIVSVICVLFAQFLKTNYVIFAIAMLIYSIFKIIETKKYRQLLFSLFLCITMIVQSFFPVFLIEKISNKKMGNGISTYAYIAMGMQDGERAPGWYNGYVNDSYYGVNNNTEKQKENSIKYIQDRLTYFGENQEQAQEFYSKKIASLWNNPTFQCFWNLKEKVSDIDKTPSWLLWMVDKDGSYSISKLLDLIMIAIYLGLVLFSLSMIQSENRLELLFFIILFIGGFVFHLMWEGKAQYTFVYFVLLIPLSIIGYSKLLKKDHLLNLNPTKMICFVLEVLILFIFITCSLSYINKDNDAYFDYLYYNQITINDK